MIPQDHLSGTSLMTSDNGTSLGTIKYYPFGGTRTGDVPTDIKYTGQRLDDTGLYYYGARYYDATIGRFISADTIVPDPMNPQAFNRYSYCLNNPLKYVDPSGNDYYMAMLAWGAQKPVAADYGDIDSYAQDMATWELEGYILMYRNGIDIITSNVQSNHFGFGYYETDSHIYTVQNGVFIPINKETGGIDMEIAGEMARSSLIALDFVGDIVNLVIDITIRIRQELPCLLRVSSFQETSDGPKASVHECRKRRLT